jgi:hypothetical protein
MLLTGSQDVIRALERWCRRIVAPSQPRREEHKRG